MALEDDQYLKIEILSNPKSPALHGHEYGHGQIVGFIRGGSEADRDI